MYIKSLLPSTNNKIPCSFRQLVKSNMKLKKKVETICPHCSEVVTDRCMKFEKKLENKIELMIYDVEEQLKSILKRE